MNLIAALQDELIAEKSNFLYFDGRLVLSIDNCDGAPRPYDLSRIVEVAEDIGETSVEVYEDVVELKIEVDA